MGDLEHARRFALSLPDATEEPHFDMSSFRVRGKIFATVPLGRGHLHVFVDELEASACVAENPAAFDVWGETSDQPQPGDHPASHQPSSGSAAQLRVVGSTHVCRVIHHHAERAFFAR